MVTWGGGGYGGRNVEGIRGSVRNGVGTVVETVCKLSNGRENTMQCI